MNARTRTGAGQVNLEDQRNQIQYGGDCINRMAKGMIETGVCDDR